MLVIRMTFLVRGPRGGFTVDFSAIRQACDQCRLPWRWTGKPLFDLQAQDQHIAEVLCAVLRVQLRHLADTFFSSS